ncbi:hypothetical protein [Mesorhizobium sp. B2-3-15]|uniref:hypothetical protein n=1 Tax=Mesorhizobium sp. B2-3-15 TaxID=2589949 RepID=UPI001FEE12B3|nr:hypothetical protein [Mesorhizobium sp. B2-3-15]
MLLDACRTNPFPADAMVRRAPNRLGRADRSWRAGTGARRQDPRQRAKADASLGIVIGFAAEPTVRRCMAPLVKTALRGGSAASSRGDERYRVPLGIDLVKQQLAKSEA